MTSNVNLRAAIATKLAQKGFAHLEDHGYTDMCVIDFPDSPAPSCIIATERELTFVIFLSGVLPEALRIDKDRLDLYGLHRTMFNEWCELAVPVAEEVLTQRLADLDDKDAPQRAIVYCGHGTGGMLAQMAAATHKPEYLVTFGSPQVGDKTFAAKLDEIPTDCRRFVLDGDPMPRTFNLSPRMRHGGREFFIDENMEVHEEPGFWKKFHLRFPENLSFDSDDHAMEWYRAAIWHSGAE